jgi:FkbM family methyltransferase
MVINNWSIEYVDAPALASIIDLLLIKKINDFSAATTQPRILDCGANIGISVLNYKRKYPDSKITAFEPDPNIIPVLRNNLMNNNASDVEIVEAAVWVNDGVSQFFCEGADGSKLVTDSQNYQNLVKVPTVNLEKFINQPIDLIKMDIEGAEFDVIPHIEHKLHYVQNLLIECHFNTDEMGKFSRLLNVLANSGFFVAVAVLGGWNDLMRKPERNVNGFDQYILVSAWRPGK